MYCIRARSVVTVVLCVTSTHAQENVIQPSKSFFGTWVYNVTSSSPDPQLGSYKCYIERLEDLGNGKVRMREHRIRGNDNQQIRNDVEIAFNRSLTRSDGRKVEFRVTGRHTYQILGTAADGTPSGFVVTRTISDDGGQMKHVGEGTLKGEQLKNNFTFDRADSTSRSGECSIE
jgi:hypothetical protein